MRGIDIANKKAADVILNVSGKKQEGVKNKMHVDYTTLSREALIEKKDDIADELREIRAQLNDFCFDCDELIDVGGNEEFWGEVCHCPDWVCPYEFNRYAEDDVCPERAELERRFEQLDVEANKLDELISKKREKKDGETSCNS